MVFQMLAFMNWPKAVLSLPISFNSPSRPVVSAADPAANGFQDPRLPTRLSSPEAGVDDVGDAKPCNVFGNAAISCASAPCCVPTGVAAAWPTAADCAVTPAA